MGPVFLVLVVAAVVVGFATGRMEAVTSSSIESARQAVELAIGLVGMMAFWLGLTEVVRRGGLMEAIARALRPVFRRLFPGIPDGHPALAAMTLNVAANMLGLANAATPLGIEAMRRLDELNPRRGTATDEMVLFLAINTSGLALLPLGAIAVRAEAGSRDPAGILLSTLLATALSTLVGGAAALLLARLPFFRRTAPGVAADPGPGGEGAAAGAPAPGGDVHWHRGRVAVSAAVVLGALGAAAWSLARIGATAGWSTAGRTAASWVPLPLLILLAVLYGWSRGVDVYAALVEGARSGFDVAVRIIPYLVAILVAVGMFRASGALDALVSLLAPVTGVIGFPGEALPMALLRPLSGSGAFAVMAETMKVHGPDSFVGYLVSTLQGSTETTFYVLAVYGGAVGVRRTRHAIPACLAGDLAGILGALAACRMLFG